MPLDGSSAPKRELLTRCVHSSLAAQLQQSLAGWAQLYTQKWKLPGFWAAVWKVPQTVLYFIRCICAPVVFACM